MTFGQFERNAKIRLTTRRRRATTFFLTARLTPDATEQCAKHNNNAMLATETLGRQSARRDSLTVAWAREKQKKKKKKKTFFKEDTKHWVRVRCELIH
jgi:hypothetical protein